MNNHPILLDLIINISCIIVGYYVGFHVKWREKQPNNNLAVAIIIFTATILLYISGSLLHVNYYLNLSFSHGGLSYKKSYQFLFASIASLLYGFFLILTG